MAKTVEKLTMTECDPMLCFQHQGLNFVCWCGKDQLMRYLHNQLCDVLAKDRPTLDEICAIDRKIIAELGQRWSIQKQFTGWFSQYFVRGLEGCGRIFGLNQAMFGNPNETMSPAGSTMPCPNYNEEPIDEAQWIKLNYDVFWERDLYAHVSAAFSPRRW